MHVSAAVARPGSNCEDRCRLLTAPIPAGVLRGSKRFDQPSRERLAGSRFIAFNHRCEGVTGDERVALHGVTVTAMMARPFKASWAGEAGGGTLSVDHTKLAA